MTTEERPTTGAAFVVPLLVVMVVAFNVPLLYMLGLGFSVTPAILGGGRVPMIASLLEILINQIPRWETAATVSTILLAATLVFFALYRRLDRRATI